MSFYVYVYVLDEKTLALARWNYHFYIAMNGWSSHKIRLRDEAYGKMEDEAIIIIIISFTKLYAALVCSFADSRALSLM